MAVNAFLDIVGVEGESIQKGYEKKIEIQSFHWGASQSATTHMGTGGGSGKANVQDISFSKYLDKTSPILLAALLIGTHYDQVVLTLRKVTGAVQLNYLVFTMNDCILSSYSTGAGTGGDDQIMENLTLNFARIKMEYTMQDSKGNPAGKTNASWDIPKGAA